MQNWNIKNWLFALSKDWILPKIAIASITYKLSSVIFSLPPNTQLSDKASKALENSFILADTQPFLIIFMIATLVAICSGVIACMDNGKTHNPWVRGATKLSTISNSAARNVVSFLVIPFSILLGAKYGIAESGGVSPGLADADLFLFLIILFGTVFHYFQHKKTAPREFITFAVTLPPTMYGNRTILARNEMYEMVTDRIGSLMAYTNRVKNKSIPVELEGGVQGQITLTVGFDLEYGAWKPENKKALKLFTKALMTELENLGYSVMTTYSPGIQ